MLRDPSTIYPWNFALVATFCFPRESLFWSFFKPIYSLSDGLNLLETMKFLERNCQKIPKWPKPYFMPKSHWKHLEARKSPIWSSVVRLRTLLAWSNSKQKFLFLVSFPFPLFTAPFKVCWAIFQTKVQSSWMFFSALIVCQCDFNLFISNCILNEAALSY